MDGLSAAASAFAVVDAAAKIASTLYKYGAKVKSARNDIDSLTVEINDLRSNASDACQLLESPSGEQLKSSKRLMNNLNNAQSQLDAIERKLDLKESRTMRSFGRRSLIWPFERGEVQQTIKTLKACTEALHQALQIEQTSILLSIDQKIVREKLRIVTGANFDSRAEEHNATCDPDTRVDLLRDIIEWGTQPDSKTVYWLSGMAGTGKSTISRTVASMMKTTPGLSLGASFFFKRGEGDRGTASGFVTTIAAQFAAEYPAFASKIKAVIDADPIVTEKTLREQFEKLIIEPWSKTDWSMHNDTIITVVDALDECDGENDIKLLLSLLSSVTQLTSPKLRFFVTSRPDLPVILGFHQQGIRGEHLEAVLQEVTQPTIRHDLRVVLHRRLVEIRVEFVRLDGGYLPDDWPTPEVLDHLVEMANPLFIFAATVCRFLADYRTGGDLAEKLKAILSYETSSPIARLESTYLPVLSQQLQGLTPSDSKATIEDFGKIVGSIILLASPLTTRELASLLDFPEGHVRNRLRSLHSVLDVRPPCGNSEFPVRLFHISFRDFLVSQDLRGNNFWIDEKKAHGTLAKKCLQLMDKLLQEDICDLKWPGILASEVDPERINEHIPQELQYACVHWANHQEQAEESAHIGLIHDFLSRRLLHWMEVLSLLGKAPQALKSIKILDHLSFPGEVGLLVQDATQFILKCTGIRDMPLQLYSSGLCFAPVNSKIRRLYQSCIPKWISLQPIVENAWDSQLQTLQRHNSMIGTIAVSPDSKLIASGSFDTTICIWSTDVGECLMVLKGHTHIVYSIAFSSDSQTIASSSKDGTTRLWKVATGEVKIIDSNSKNGDHWVRQMMLSSDLRTVKSFASDGTIRSLKTDDGERYSTERAASLLDELPPGAGRRPLSLGCCAISPDFKLVASLSGSLILVRSAETGAICKELLYEDPSISCLLFTPDGEKLISDATTGKLRVWSVRTGVNQHAFDRPNATRSSQMAISADGSTLAIAYGDETVYIWSLKEMVCRAKLPGRCRLVSSMAFSLDGQILYLGFADGGVRSWSVERSGLPSVPEPKLPMVYDMIFSPDRRLIACSGRDMTLMVWDTQTGRCIMSLNDRSGRYSPMFEFSPDSGVLLLLSSFYNTLKLYSLENGTAMCEMEVEDGSKEIELFPDGNLFLTQSSPQSSRIGFPRGLTAHFFPDGPGTEKKIWPIMGTSCNEEGLQLMTNGSWIEWNEQRLFWLPPELRNRHDVLLSSGDFIALGSSGGGIFMLRVCSERLPAPPERRASP